MPEANRMHDTMLTRRTLMICAAATAALATIGWPGAREAQAQAPTSEAAVAFINQAGQDLVAVVNSNEPEAARRAQLGRVIERIVDIPAVAQFCLGRFWRTATPAQQKEFTALFDRVIVISIGGHLGDYRGVSFTIGRAIANDSGVAVRTTLVRPNNPPARVDWVVSKASGAPRIIDVLAEGTSLRLTQRSDYASFLANNGNDVQKLIDALRKQVETAT